MSIAKILLSLVLGPQPVAPARAGLLRRAGGSSRAALDAADVY